MVNNLLIKILKVVIKFQQNLRGIGKISLLFNFKNTFYYWKHKSKWEKMTHEKGRIALSMEEARTILKIGGFYQHYKKKVYRIDDIIIFED